MFTIKNQAYSEEELLTWEKIFNCEGINIKAIPTSFNSHIIFTYNLKWLKKIISNTSVSSYLNKKSYPDNQNINSVLKELFKRIQNNSKFPHEVGIFLGYPLEDVVCFEKNQGKNCKYCGYWKSYTNPSEAENYCCKYVSCGRMCKHWFDEGYSVPQIIKEYKKVTNTVA